MKNFVFAILTLTLLSFSAQVSAQGLGELDNSLTAEASNLTEAYAFVSHVREQVPSLQARARGPIAVVGPMLEAYGPQALDPMLRELIDDRSFGFAKARRAWRVGLLHAVGRMHRERSRPVLEHVLATDSDLEVVRAAANALGKMLDLEAARHLIKTSSEDTDRARAVLAGMGTCRRSVVALHLAERLSRTDDPRIQLTAILSLRDVANSWAWKTSRVAASGEHKATSAAARDALVEAFFAIPGQESEITKALLIVNDPKTAALVQKRSAEASSRAQRLLHKLQANPLDR